MPDKGTPDKKTRIAHAQGQPIPGLDVRLENRPMDIQAASTQQWSAPLPDPASAKKYDDLLPGAFERILALHEKQVQTHCRVAETNAQTQRIIGEKFGQNQELAIKGQREVAEESLKVNATEKKRGQGLGFFGFVICVLLGAYLFYIGRDLGGGALVGSPVMIAISSFLEKSLLSSKKQKPKNE